jgi:hypothetical protein
MFYDTLIRRRVDLPAPARASAGLAECVAGIRLHGTERAIRVAIAAAAVVERYGPARTTMADPALVELVISSGSDEAARARALRLLGFAAGLPVRVAAESPDQSWREARTALRFTTAHQPVVHYDSLGALALLAQIPQTPRETTPTSPRSPGWPATQKT